MDRISFEFLKSTRFWALVIGALFVYVQAKGWIGEAERNFFATIFGGFTLIRTVDRNVGDAKITAAAL